MRNFLQEAFEKALQEVSASLLEEARKMEPLFGRSPIVDLSNVVDSTATVIDDEEKALSEPK